MANSDFTQQRVSAPVVKAAPQCEVRQMKAAELFADLDVEGEETQK